MSESWFCEQIENLRIQENRLSALLEIRVRLGEMDGCNDTHLEGLVSTRLLSAPEIYECLELGGGSDELATDILSTCMSHLCISQSNLPALLGRALTHSRAQIRAMALNAILMQLEKERKELTNSDISEEIVNHVLNCLRHENTEVGAPAIAILSIVLRPRLNQQTIKESLLNMLASTETIRCRLYELAVNLAKLSSSMLLQIEFLLDCALSELDNDDVLFQVNILEILVSLSEQNHGILYLEERQVFDIISRRLENVDQNPLNRLLIPGIMKFFGKAASMQPQKVILGYPHMIQCFFEGILSGDVSILPAAFDTFVNLVETKEGKLLLDQNYPKLLKEAFEEIASYLRNLSTDLKKRAFSTLEMIFTTDSVNQADTQELLQKWFNHLAGGDNMQFLMDFCRNPFPDIKVSCLSFIKSLCLNRWAIVALKDTAGFVEYLLDRKIEFDKEAKYKKFELINMLAESDVFDVQTSLQLRTYSNEGPYFVQSIMDVAIEGN